MNWLEIPGADWAAGLLPDALTDDILTWRDNIWQLTLEYIRANRHMIDIFLCYLYPKQIDVNAIKEIKRMGIPCVNFYCDNVREFYEVPNEFKVFDLNWVPEYEALHMYRQANTPYINLPMPMWVDPRYRSIASNTNFPGISFIGSKDVYREQLLGHLTAKGLPVQIRGSGWLEKLETAIDQPLLTSKKIANQLRFVNDNGLKGLLIKSLQKAFPVKSERIASKWIYPMPDFEEYNEITQQSSIVLGINRVHTFKRLHQNPLVYSRLRDIEAPMLGACYLTEYCEGVAQLYEIEKDILTYRTTDELIHKATWLLADKQEQQRLRVNGQNRVLNEHTISASLQKLKSALFK